MNPVDWSDVVLYCDTDALFVNSIMNDDEEIWQEDLYMEYSEYNFDNENEQAFLDAGHFYGIG